MSKPIHLTNDNFDREVLASDVPVLVDFWASWCSPCRAIAPTVESVAGEYAGRVKVGKLDVDEARETARRFHIKSIPSLLLFKGGEVVDSTIGAVPRSRIDALLRPHLEPAQRDAA